LKKQIAFLEKVKKSQTDLGLSIGAKPKVSPEIGLDQRTKKRRSTSYDTGLEGAKGNRFRELEKAILKGEVGTSRAEIKKVFGVGDEIAGRYQGKLLEKGVIRYKDKGRGYEVVSEAKRINGVG
jgi:hypothetical protein